MELKKQLTVGGFFLWMFLFAALTTAVAAEGTLNYEQKTDLPVGMAHLGAEVINGKIYLVAGMSDTNARPETFVYNPETNEYEQLANILGPRSLLSGSHTSIGSSIYVVGGRNNSGNQTSTLQEYDVVTNTWSTKKSMAQIRFGVSAITYNNFLYAIGGRNETSDVKVVERYNPSTNTWTTMQSMPSARRYAQSIEIEGKIYVMGGGVGTTATILNKVEMYDPTTNTWTTKANMPHSRVTFGAFVLDNKIYAIGGSDNNGYVLGIDVYDPATDTWTTLDCKLPYGINGFGLALIDREVYIFGGASEKGNKSVISLKISELSVPSLSVDGDTTAVLNWNEVEGAEGYKLLRSVEQGGPYVVIVDNLQGTTYEDSHITPGTAYYYKVKAFNSLEEGCCSNEVLFELEEPVYEGNRGILEITMTNGLIKEYDLSAEEIEAFLNWYLLKSEGIGSPLYTFPKHHTLGPFIKRTEYVIHKEILMFEVMEY